MLVGPAEETFSCNLRLLLFQGKAVVIAVEKSYPGGQLAWLQVTWEEMHYLATIENGG